MNDFLNETTGHMILGGLAVLFASPIFIRLGFPLYLFVLIIPLFLAIFKELGDHFKLWNHGPNGFRQSVNDISEWMFGAVIFTAILGIDKFVL